jgi:hypothetical protein
VSAGGPRERDNGVVIALTIPGLDLAGPWQVRNAFDPAANALADRHYNRQQRGSGQVGPPGRKLVFVTHCERAVWVSHWPYADLALDGLDAWRCTIFRNEGAGLSSDLIRAAMNLTALLWSGRPTEGWITWIDRRQVRSTNPGYCFKQAGWSIDRTWQHPHLVRLRALVPSSIRGVATSTQQDPKRRQTAPASSTQGSFGELNADSELLRRPAR